MKYRITAVALLVAVLAGLAFVLADESPRPAMSQPAGTDDAAMKSLSIN